MFASGAKNWNNGLSINYTDEELVEKGIPLEWFPKNYRILLSYNLHKNKYKICKPTQAQINEGYLGEKGKRRRVYAHRCTPGGSIRYYCPNDSFFEEWIKRDSSKKAILGCGPYYHACVWKGKIYEGKDPELIPYYESSFLKVWKNAYYHIHLLDLQNKPYY